VLQIGSGGTTGSITGNVVDNANLTFNRSDNLAFGGIISGTGSLTKIGAGRVILTGANTYTGGTTITAGILRVGNGGTQGSIVGDIKAVVGYRGTLYAAYEEIHDGVMVGIASAPLSAAR